MPNDTTSPALCQRDLINQIEKAASKFIKALSNVKSGNTQPPSRPKANALAFGAFCDSDKILNSGGHLSRGAKGTFSSALYNGLTYEFNE